MAIPNFAPTAFGSVSANGSSQNIALPAAGTTLLVVNMGPNPAAVLLSTDDTAVVDGSKGTVVLSGGTLALAIGSNTRLACIALGMGSAWLNLSVGA